MSRASWVAAVIGGILGGVLFAFLIVPVLVLLAAGGVAGVAHLATDAELVTSLVLTALAAAAATLAAALGGVPIAYLLARRAFRGRSIVVALLDLPLLIPHPVAGIALLLLVSRDTPLGRSLLTLGVRIVGTPAGIVAAMTFVSAPIFVSAARDAFARVNREYDAVARTLGDDAWRAFRRVTLPMAARGLWSAAAVTWARAVSEFGAVVVLVYNPKVASVLSYDRLTSYGLSEALPVAAVLVLVSMVPLIAVRALRGADGAY